MLLCGLLILAIQYYISTQMSSFVGTDNKSVDVIKEIAPNYQPWASPVWEHDSPLAEPLLFSLQAALGLAIIIYYILKQHAKYKSVR